MKTLQCPTCAASIKADASGGATCPYCGTQNQRRRRAVVDDREIPPPTEIPPAPPAEVPMDTWQFEDWIGAFLRETDGDRQLAMADAMPAFGEEHLVWAPVLADRMMEADARLDLALGNALSRLARTWKSVALQGQVLRVIRARLPRLHSSRGVVVALEGVGVAGLKTLLELADDADKRGDAERVAEVLTPIWTIIDRQTDEVAAACLEILVTLLPGASPAGRQFIVHYLADCIDSRYEVALPGPRNNRNFRFLIPMMVRFIDEHATHHPDLVAELVAEIERLHTYHSKSYRDAQSWGQAMHQARSDVGQAVVHGLIQRLYPADSPFAPQRSGAAWTDVEEVSGEVEAEVGGGRARCPACGTPVPIRGSEIVVPCSSCGRSVRIPPGLRTELDGWLFKEELEHWSEGELVTALRSEPDAERRRMISEEIHAARTHGSRYVEWAQDVVDQMIEDPDEEVVINLEHALTRMIRTGGDAFRDAVLAAVRMRPAARSQPRLLRCLAPYGRSSFDLLFAYGHRSFSESITSMEAASDGAAAFNALSEALHASGYPEDMVEQLLASVLAMPATYDDEGVWQTGEAAAGVLGQIFLLDADDQATEATRRVRRDTILRVLDTHIDPEGTHYTGLAPHPGCALFTELGGAPGLARLVGFIESLWEGPADVDDLRSRLGWIAQAQTDAVKLLVLCSIKERPVACTPADLEQAERVLAPLLEVPHLSPSAAVVRSLVRGSMVSDEPPETPFKKGTQAERARRFPATRGRQWWYFLKALVRSLLTRLRH